MKNTIAFIGTVGVPNNYGGFEMFLESCAPELSKSFKTVIVTCDKARYENRGHYWHGVRRVFIPVSANGALSVIHDFLAFFAVFWRAKVIIVLGVSGGIFFPLFRFLCAILDKKLIANVDGVEWRRAKFSRARRLFLYISDRLAQKCAHQVVVDNDALRPFLVRSVRETAALIAYPGDHVMRVLPKAVQEMRDPQCLTICRIEPENNCHILIEAFARADRGSYIFIGNWNASEYGRGLKERYKDLVNLDMRNPIYDKNILASIRENCTLYLHGHSVGGTNPSLVEMLFYDCNILAFDCAFNRFTADNAIQYFLNQDELATQIKSLTLTNLHSRANVRLQYTKAQICGAYTELIKNIIRPQKSREYNRYNPPLLKDVENSGQENSVKID